MMICMILNIEWNYGTSVCNWVLSDFVYEFLYLIHKYAKKLKIDIYIFFKLIFSGLNNWDVSSFLCRIVVRMIGEF